MGNRAFVILVVALALGVVLLFFQRQVEEAVAPELQRVWVAIEVVDGGDDGSAAEAGPARIGRVELRPDQRFRLHAVVEGRRGDEPIYYTEASRLAFGDDEVSPERLRPWERSRPVKVRWVTVEGRVPFVPLDASSSTSPAAPLIDLEDFPRSDWPLAWSIDGRIDPAYDDHFDDDPAGRTGYGTLRYGVRFELYRLEDDLIPSETFQSWGAATLERAVAGDQVSAEADSETDAWSADEVLALFPTAVVAPADRSAPIARLFGLTQLQPSADADPSLLDAVQELAAVDLAFSRGTALRDLLRSVDRSWSDLAWSEVELGVEALDVAPGDLIRVGDRVVVFARHADGESSGRLDAADLCYDFAGSLTLRRIDDVFEGGVLDVASLVPSGSS